MTLIINLFGGPGTGKSTCAAGVFSELKQRGVNCELVTEFAKDKVWEESYRVLENQIYVFGKQLHRIHRLLNKVDVIVTDSPLLLSLHYGCKYSFVFKALVMEQHSRLNSLNIFLQRKKKYNPAGRMQTESEAREIDLSIEKLLKKNDIEFMILPACRDAISAIANIAMGKVLVDGKDPVTKRELTEEDFDLEGSD